jgi:hypothetical protein
MLNFKLKKSIAKSLVIFSFISFSTLSMPFIFNNNVVYSKQKDYQKTFNKSLFVGDSMTEALYEYEFLDEKNVAARMGLSLWKAEHDADIMQKVREIKPKNIFIMFGNNDIEEKTKVEKFLSDYKKLINKIKSKDKKAKIYIQSILPITTAAENKAPFVKNSTLEKFNSALKSMAKKEHYYYLNIREVLNESKKDLHEQDGVHFKYEFYPLYLDYISKNVKGLK